MGWRSKKRKNPQSQGHAPNGCIWVRQIKPALLSFLHGKTGSLRITYRVSAFKNCASPITQDVENFLGVERGNENCQQVLECLNMLVALRTWKNFWRKERVRLEVRSDNIGALTLVMSLKGGSKAMNQVARELALDLGDAAYRPDIVTHTPGVASSIADTLSRKFSPTKPFCIPTVLENVPEIFPATRDKFWWRSLDDGRSTLD